MPLVQDPIATFAFGPPATHPPPQPTDLTAASFEEAIGRPPAFPLYICSSNELFDQHVGYLPGRICLGSRSGEHGLFRPDMHDLLCPQDVLHAWLYEVYFGPGGVPMVERADDMLPVIRDIGPQVRAVMVANDQAETGFMEGAHEGFIDRPHGGTDDERIAWVLRCTEFIKQSGGLLRDMGVRPAYGLYHFHALLHAYWADNHFPGGDPLRKALQDLDALVIIFIGTTFWLDSARDIQPLNHWDPHEVIVPKNHLDSWPYPRLISWIKSMECWSGVEFMPGLRGGNDILLAGHGFKAGVIGEVP